MSLIKVDWNPGGGQLRTFGVICAVVCVALAGLTIWRGSILGIDLNAANARYATYALVVVAAASSLLALTKPTYLRPVYLLATTITLPIGFVVSYVALGVLYFLVLTPLGLVFRLVARDALARAFDRSAPSYWVRRAPVNDMNRYFHQF